jgi:hypothetical protein
MWVKKDPIFVISMFSNPYTRIVSSFEQKKFFFCISFYISRRYNHIFFSHLMNRNSASSLHFMSETAASSLTESLADARLHHQPATQPQSQAARRPVMSSSQTAATITSKPNSAQINPWFSKHPDASSYLSQSGSRALLDPFERDRIRDKIDRLLKLALTNSNTVNSREAASSTCSLNSEMMNKLVLSPGTTPISSSPTTPSPLGVYFSPAQQQQRAQQRLEQANPTMHVHTAASLASKATNEALRKRLHSAIWKELYDYFQYYGDRSTSIEQIDKRLEQDRAKIPLMIADISNTDFASITRHIERAITDCMRTPGDFASLATHKQYKEQLCYIYWLVEDKLNDIGYLETLYPSARALRESQPAYADPRFEATAKTLVLWYKMMSDLMARSDALGRFLGFTKRSEAKAYWPWFHDGLSYTRDEYLKTHSKIETWFEHQHQQISHNTIRFVSLFVSFIQEI